MKDRALIKTGIAGTAITMLSCLAPVLTLLLGALGPAAWLAWADYVLLPALAMFMAIAAVGVFRLWRNTGTATCCDTEAAEAQEIQR